MRRARDVILVLCGALTLIAVASRGGVYHKSLTPRILSEWVKSDDGRLSVCLVVDKTTFSKNEPLIVRCAVRNNTDRPLTILRPFGDPFYAHSTGLRIVGPDGEIQYRGPMKEYVLGTGSFHDLPAHSVIDETLELPKKYLPGLGVTGLYTIRYAYSSSGYPKKKPRNLWEGKIETGKVHILVQEKRPDN